MNNSIDNSGGGTTGPASPAVVRQELKDITLVHAAGDYAGLAGIGEQATKDLGFTVEMRVLDYVELTEQMFNVPTSMDIADTDMSQTKMYLPRGVTQAIDINRIKLWDKILPLFREGTFAGDAVTRQGNAPINTLYRAAKDATSAHDGVTEWATHLPIMYNVDTLGVRPDLVGREITTWADLIDPAFHGKAALINIPVVGFMDAALALEAAGEVKFENMGEPTRDEFDAAFAKLIELKRSGFWRALWNSLDEAADLMASGETVIQSMWEPTVIEVRSRGVACGYPPLQEGYRSWANGMALMAHLDGLKLEAAYEYLNWYLEGYPGALIARQGYYSSLPETAKRHLTDNEWGFFYGGQPATGDIVDPTGRKTYGAGDVREGGAYEERTSHIAVWNSNMDDVDYLFEKWEELRAA